MSKRNANAWIGCLCLCALLGCAGPGGSEAKPKARPGEESPGAAAKASAGEDDQLREAAKQPSAPLEGEGWQSMFDGKTLTGWRETKDFAGRGEVRCVEGLMVLEMGDPFTGINWTNPPVTIGYEIALDAMRVNGSDFFCGLTVPVSNSYCSLIVGGWGGSLIGISSLDGMDASENETTRFMNFEQGKWYRIRLRVTESRIEGWIDKEKLINVVTTDRKISLRPGDIEYSKPLGIASFQTTAALRRIQLRRVATPDGPAPKTF